MMKMICDKDTAELEQILAAIRRKWKSMSYEDTRLEFLRKRVIDELLRRHRLLHPDDCPYNEHGCGTHAQCVKCLLNYSAPI